MPAKYPGKKHFKEQSKERLSVNLKEKNPADAQSLPKAKSTSEEDGLPVLVFGGTCGVAGILHEGCDARVPRTVIRRGFEAGHIDERDCGILLEALDGRGILNRAYRKSLALEAEALIRDRYHPVLLRLDAMLRAKAGR